MSPTLKKAATLSGEHRFGGPFGNRAAAILDWLVGYTCSIKQFTI